MILFVGVQAVKIMQVGSGREKAPPRWPVEGGEGGGGEGGRGVTSSDFARGAPWQHLTTASNLHKKSFENWWIGDGDYQLCSADLWISNTLISHIKSRFRKTLYTLKVSNSGFLFRFCLTNYDWHSTIYNFSDLEKILWTRQAMLRHTHTPASTNKYGNIAQWVKHGI